MSEACFKEAMVCEISPLGFHLALSMKEKIWKHEFVDLLSLLPSIKENYKSDKKSHNEKDSSEILLQLGASHFYICVYFRRETTSSLFWLVSSPRLYFKSIQEFRW